MRVLCDQLNNPHSDFKLPSENINVNELVYSLLDILFMVKSNYSLQ